MELSRRPIPDVTSQLHPDLDGGRGLLRSILELFYLGLCSSEGEVEGHLKQTLLFAECKNEVSREEIIRAGVDK